MNTRLSILLLVATWGSILRADDLATPQAAAPAPPEGIIILKAVPGYPAADTWFVSIQWVDRDSGYVIDKAGAKLPFLTDAVGRIIYFDKAYYDEIDHNQYWVDWRAGLQSREAVLPPIPDKSLRPEDAKRLADEQAVLQDAIDRYGNGTDLVQPLIDTLTDETAKLASGQVMQNGTWIALKDAAVAPDVVPVVGDSEARVSFTTKDGKRFLNARVTVTDTGLSVLTDDGGASISFDQLPESIDRFPKTVRDRIADWRVKHPAVVVAAPEVAPATAPAPATWWGWIVSTYHYAADNTYKYFSSSKETPQVDASSASTTAPASASGASTPSPTTPAAAPNLSDTIVLIKGDYAEGTGFLTRTVSGPVVITNLHVIAGNPNIKIMTNSGEEIVPLSMQGATDRDMAMFSITDNNYHYLDLSPNIESNAAVGDAAIIPGDSEGGEVTLKTKGSIVGIGPQLVEFNNPIFHGNSGGPVVDTKTGKVIAVATFATEMTPRDDLDKSSFANANSAIKGPMRYFGLRIDTVPAWQSYDLHGFVQETLFLQTFHNESRALDSYLNGARNTGPSPVPEEGALDAKYFLTNDKIRKANEDCQAEAQSGHTRALEELAWKLDAIGRADLGSVQDISTFYPYDQGRAKYELKYRKELLDEVQRIRDKIGDPNVNPNANKGV